MRAMERHIARQTGNKVAPSLKRDTVRSVSLANSREADLLRMQQTLGNQAVQQWASTFSAISACPTGGVCHPCPYRVQAKSIISQPGDQYEQEADRVAEAAVQAQEARAVGRASIFYQATGLQIHRVCAECEEEMNAQVIEEEDESRIEAAVATNSVEATQMATETESLVETDTPNEPSSTTQPVARETSPEAVETPTPTEVEVGTTNEPATSALIVEDSTEPVGPDQIRKGEFLAEVRAEVCRTVEEMISPTGRSTSDCPYLEFVFAFFAQHSAQYV
jgi:hypothetical protein